MTEFKIATYNVHSFTSRDFHDNIAKIAGVIKNTKPDIICLQEVGDDSELNRFIEASFFKYCLTSAKHGFRTALLSNIPMEEIKSLGPRKARYVTASLKVNEEILYVTSLHLDYRTEPIRMKEIEAIERNLMTAMCLENLPQVWAGDYNSLCREDYTEEAWEEVARIRRLENWEEPKTQVTNKMKDLGFVDCWATVGRPGPISTCRYNTHIDYIYINKPAASLIKCSSVEHLENTPEYPASDHSMVLATFILQNCGSRIDNGELLDID